MSKERARLDMAHKLDELIIIALRKQAKDLERAELARCAEESEKQSEYEGGLLDRIAELEKAQRDIIKDIKLCFGHAIASDSTLLVNVDAYNSLVTTCNNTAKALKEQSK